MKLETLETFVVGNPPPRHGGRYFIFVRLTTACGITGVGEIYNATFGPDICCAMARDMFERQFDGADPHHIEALFRKSYGAGFTQRPDVSVMGVFSGLEMACWDIIGKAADKPIYELLGGRVHDRLRSYSYIYPPTGDVYPDPARPNAYNDAAIAAEVAAGMVAQGFTAVKFDPAGPFSIYDGRQPRLDDIALSVAFCREIRAAVGEKADLLFGTHGQFTVSGAKRMARAIERFDPLWFEEPIPPDNLLEFQEVAQAVRIPIATGERLTTKSEFATLLRTGGAKILQPALGRVGGLNEARKIAALAEAFNAQIAPHLYAGPLEWAANIQLAAALPNALMVESISTEGSFHEDLIRTPIRVENGHITPPTAPGMGVELNEDVARANPYEGHRLHLEMQGTPHDYSQENWFEGG